MLLRLPSKPFATLCLLISALPCLATQNDITTNGVANPDAYRTTLPDPFSHEGWELEIDRNEMQIYTREWPGSDFIAVKAVQTISSSLSNIIANYAEIESFPEWVNDMAEAREVTQLDPNRSRVVYMRMNMPWPLQDRDIVASQRFSQDPSSKIVKVREKDDNDAVPLVDGIIRAPKTNMELLLVPKSENQTQLIFQGHNDPGGFIPSFLVNWMIEDVFYGSMLNMKHRFESSNDVQPLDWVQDYSE